MSLFYSYSSGLLPDNSFPPGGLGKTVFFSTINIQPITPNPEKTGMCIGVILFLLALVILHFTHLERVKNSRMMRQGEQVFSDLFSKITHEIRTPLTIILGLSKQLRNEKNLSTGNLSTYLNSIERQGRGMSELFNQLLDLANLNASDRILEWKTGNIVAYVEMVSETFKMYAKEKEIELTFFSDETEIETNFVPDYINKILHNLLSNAIKFSEEGSSIYLAVERSRKDRKKVVIKVIDQGKGISAEALPHVFDLFYTYPHKDKQTATGHGIGLALVKQLVEVLDGTVRVKSEVGKGTTFRIELPIQKNEKKLYSHWKIQENSRGATISNSTNLEVNELFSSEANLNDLRTTILVAEDNKDIARYIRSVFNEDQYQIVYASNGEKAWEIATQCIPDIVITDVMMPKKSGIELCNDIKSCELLNHIPVVLVSAKSKESDLIEGFRCGADSYVRKPFAPEELRVRVENLLMNRKLLKEKYGRLLLKEVHSSTEDPSNLNTKFLRHVTDIIYREMKNADFTPSDLARELAISQSQLNKKMNALTGHPSSTYINNVKLDYAKKLLRAQDKTIAEVAAQCSFYDVNYFSRIFKKYTGITPSQFKRLPQD